MLFKRKDCSHLVGINATLIWAAYGDIYGLIDNKVGLNLEEVCVYCKNYKRNYRKDYIAYALIRGIEAGFLGVIIV